MAIATMTSKGQVTIPKAIRERLGLRAGDRLDFEVARDGRVVVQPVGTEGEPVSLAGFLNDRVRVKHPVTVEEMDEAIGQAVAEEYYRSVSVDE